MALDVKKFNKTVPPPAHIAPEFFPGNDDPDLPANGSQLPTVSEKLKGLEIYYDHNRKAYWGENNRDGWIIIATNDVRRWLAERGFNPKPAAGEKVSAIDRLITLIQKSNDIDYANSLAGFRKGLYEVAGKRILVRDSPELIDAKPGKFPLIDEITLNMLGPQQRNYLFGRIF